MTEQEQALPPTASSFARAALLVYTLLVVYASWYPFSGWQMIGLAPWDFLLAPLPHYWTVFDVSTNVFGYMPFGLLIVFALYPSVRGLWAVAIAFVAGLLLSSLMEAGQTFLPSRVSSNLDLLPNAGGALFGAIGGMLLSRVFLEQSRLLELRKNWFIHDAGAGRGLIVVALWPLAQIYPQGYLFGHGQIMPILSDWTSKWLSRPINFSEMALSGIQLTVQEYWLAETIITACGFAGAMLAMLCLLRKPAPKTALILLLAGITLTSKWLASALLFSPQNGMAWLTPGAQGGLLIGAMLVGGLAFAPPDAQRRLAAFSLAVSVLVANFVPVNPYFVATLQAWLQGKFLNFNGAAQFLSLVWPFFAIWFLVHPMHRRKRRQRGV